MSFEIVGATKLSWKLVDPIAMCESFEAEKCICMALRFQLRFITRSSPHLANRRSALFVRLSYLCIIYILCGRRSVMPEN